MRVISPSLPPARGLHGTRHRPGIRLACLALLAFMLAGCTSAWRDFERNTLNPGVRSDETPGSVGLPFERIAIPSGSRTLDAYLVAAGERCAGPSAAVLLFHGRNETVADWFAVQRLLRERCVTSLVFDYSGHGRSSAGGTIASLDEDALAAARYFGERFASTRRCLIGFSMGAALALQAAARGAPADACVVLVGPFASLKAMAELSGTSRLLTPWFSDEWNNVKLASSVTMPLLWLHSRSDEIVPFEQGLAVFRAHPGPRRAVELDGLDHNAIHRIRPDAIWDPIVRFVRAMP